jgi:ketosteroid isomerase-like protein
MDQGDSTDVLRGFITQYGEAWNADDVDAIMNAYATPCFVVKGDRVLRHNDETAKRRYFTELLASNNQHGPHTWSIGDVKLQPLGRDAALATVRWIAQRPDKSVLWDFLDSYLLAVEEGQWRILGDVVHD